MQTSTFPLRQASIRWKLLGAFLLLVASLVLVAAAAVGLLFDAAQRAAVLEAEHVAAEVAAGFERRQQVDMAGVQDHVAGVGKLFDRDLFVVNRHGVVTASTNPRAVGTVYHSEHILEAMRSGQPRAFIGPDITDSGDARQVVVPLSASANPAGAGAVVFEYTQVYGTLMAEARHAALLIGAAALVLVGLGWLLGLRVTRALVHPLARLEQAATGIADGNYDVDLPVESHDELGRLTLAFNEMGWQLRQGRAALEDRNAELAQTNARLEDGMAQQIEAAKRIEYLAYNDNLTGLPNRAQFSLVLSRAIANAERYQEQFGLFFIDLDRFKQINDTLGHAAGDALLVEVAERLRRALRDSDTIARLGGDEFVVLVPRLKHDRHAQTVARKVLAAIAAPMHMQGQELRVTASVGVSCFARDGEDEQTLMKHADIAMYQVKESGRDGFAFYSPERDANTLERLALENSLRGALERDELQLHYQPKLDCRTGRITGMEALLRWQHPELGLVSPAHFIPVAEETGLIVPIGQWVLRQACLQTKAWRLLGLKDLVVAVNLSPRQFQDENLLSDIVAVLHDTGMEGRWLELEITESVIVHDADNARKLLLALKALGISIAVDDFGTGYSSLSTLKHFPIDTLKIDRSFIHDLTNDSEDRGLTEAIIQMGKALKLHLVAEGVETVAQAEFLHLRGCHQLQGYLFSKPLPAAAFAAFLQQHRAETTHSGPAANETRFARNATDPR